MADVLSLIACAAQGSAAEHVTLNPTSWKGPGTGAGLVVLLILELRGSRNFTQLRPKPIKPSRPGAFKLVLW